MYINVGLGAVTPRRLLPVDPRHLIHHGRRPVAVPVVPHAIAHHIVRRRGMRGLGQTLSQLNAACAAGQLPTTQCSGGSYVPSAAFAAPTGYAIAPASVPPGAVFNPVTGTYDVPYLGPKPSYAGPGPGAQPIAGGLNMFGAPVGDFPVAPGFLMNEAGGVSLIPIGSGGGAPAGSAPPPSGGGGGGSTLQSAQMFGAPISTTSRTSAVQPAVSLQNTSRPGQPFQVGDTFQLTVKGAPNQPVSGSATQNGSSLGTTAYGSTDATGSLVLNGTMDASTVGAWREMWTVGAAAAPVLIFSVAAAGQTGGGGGGSTSSGSGAGASGGGYSLADIVKAVQSSGGGGGSPAAAPSAPGFLSSTFSIGGVNVPVWAAAAGALGLVWVMGGRH